jgi:Lrp/AsnC family leucine-responsive transcriptional regulator
MLKVRAASMEHLEGLLERLGEHGEMRTSIVLSTQYEGRPVERPNDDFHRPTPSEGWSRTDRGRHAEG